MPWSRSNGLSIFYEVAGEGPPLVLLHANPFDHTMWLYQIARFSRRFRVVAIDLRGYGRSDKPEQPFAFSDMANDILGVVRDRGFDRIALAGVSIGATLALQIALDHPNLVRALILVGGESGNPAIFTALARDYAARPISEQRIEHIRMIVGDDFARSPLGRYLLDAFLESTPRLSGKSISEIFRARAAVNLADRLAAVSAPTLVINGATDVSLESGRYTASRIPGALHRIVPDAGHICCLENPWAFDRLVLDFLAARGYEVA
ncbi:MAG TPA: alpha/beta fold hydrolase [Alphaproteobacteria bacterium]|jgi:pimeloyl-ACP methyl ester carboxylesterase